MYTQCRGCGEVFVVEVDHLIHARGNVRCNLCGTVFDGLETLSAVKPHEDEDLLLHDFDNAPPLLTQSYQSMSVHDADEEEFESESDDTTEFAVEEFEYEDVNNELTGSVNYQEPEPIEPIPEFITNQDLEDEGPFLIEKKRKPQISQESRWLWAGLSAVLLIGLLWQAQVALASGQVKLPEHPISTKVCQMVNCSKPNEAVDLNAISLVSRNIRPHPGRDQALIISASMINANKDNQKFPALEIKLSDLNGQIVAMRRFVAEEYVPSDVFRAGFVANTLIPVNLEIASPGPDAVAFEIGFVQP